jgi:hypothetical protein
LAIETSLNQRNRRKRFIARPPATPPRFDVVALVLASVERSRPPL